MQLNKKGFGLLLAAIAWFLLGEVGAEPFGGQAGLAQFFDRGIALVMALLGVFGSTKK